MDRGQMKGEKSPKGGEAGPQALGWPKSDGMGEATMGEDPETEERRDLSRKVSWSGKMWKGKSLI